MSRTMVWSVVGIAVGVCACDNRPTPAVSEPDAGASDKYATADPKLEHALRSAASASVNTSGPPPRGVFAPGEADRRHPKEMPTALEIVWEGDEPRVSLLVGSPANIYGPALLEMEMQMGPRSALPTIDLSLMLAPSKSEDAGAPTLIAEIRKAIPAKEQPGELSTDVVREISAIAGTHILTRLSTDGRTIGGAEVQLGKEAHTELFARNAAESVMLATVPLPDKPVGVGAAWIAETRTEWAGVDVISYRAFRVKTVSKDRATLSLDVNGYAASSDVQLPDVPKGAVLAQFDARAQGEIEIAPREPVARRAQIAQRVALLFAPEGQENPGPQGAPGEGSVTEQREGQMSFARANERGSFAGRNENQAPR